MARAAAVWLLLSAGAICAAQPAPRPDAPPDAELAALDQTLVDLGLDAGALAFEDGVALTRALLTGERRAAWLGALLKQRGAAPVASRTALDRELGWLDAVRARCEALASPGGVAATTFRDARLMTSEQWGALARGSQSARGALVLAHTVNVVADVEIRGAGGEARSSFAADQPMEVALAIRSREAEPVIRAVGLKLTLTRAVAGAAPVTHEFPSVALASAGGPEQVWRLEADAARPTGEWTLGVSVTSADAAWPASTSAELVKLAEPVTAAITITAPAVANNGGAGAPPVASTSRTENLSRWSMASLLRGLADPASQAAVEWYLGLSANEPPNVANWVPANAAPLFAPDATVAQPTIGQFQNQGANGANEYLNAAARYKANRVRSTEAAERFKGGPLKALAVQVQADGLRFNFVGFEALSSSPTNARYDLVVELVRLADGAVEGVALLRTAAVGAAESYYRIEWLPASPDEDAVKQRLRALVQQMPARNRVDVLMCLDRGMKSMRDGAQQWLGATSVRFSPFAAFELQMPAGAPTFSTRQRQFLEGFPVAQ